MPPRPDQGRIAVVVTGSVAAVKTFLLADALEKQGLAPDFIVTPAAWPFIKSEGKYKPTPERIAALEEKAVSSLDAGFVDILARVDAVLVSPASADFIRQLAYADTKIGTLIKTCGKPLFLAPAMNFMMWNHPAVQKNVKALMAESMRILGPAYGDMACGDHGYGRLAEPDDIAQAVRNILEGRDDTLLHEVEKSLPAKPSLSSVVPAPCRKILLVMHADDGAAAVRVHSLREKGYEVQCVVTEEARQTLDIPALRKLTGHAVVWDHHQIYLKDGMEHIWLPEDADAVVMWPATRAYVAEMAKGAAESFNGCLYLASKRPIFIVPAQDCDGDDLQELRAHGAIVTDEGAVADAIKAHERQQPPVFDGKSFLVLGGSPREVVDSFRFYINTTRPEEHGARVAAEIEARGGRVTFLPAAGSARDLLAMCRAGDFEIVLQLASISQITCPRPAAHKISKRGDDRARLFEVEGNIDVISELRDLFGAGKVLGYNNYQEWEDDAHSALKHKVISLVRRSAGRVPCA